MTNKLITLIFKLFINILWLLFINNPISPLSIPILKTGGLFWHPLIRFDSIEYYQVFLSVLALIGLLMTIGEFIFRRQKELFSIVEDALSIGTMILIRGIPQTALNFSSEILTKYYQTFYWFINISILMTMINGVLKAFNFAAKQRNSQS